MALLDYKIVRFSHEGRHVSADIRVYRGQYRNVDWLDIDGVTHTDLRYVRTAKVLERHFEVDVPRDMTRAEFIVKVRAYLNRRLLDYADANLHTVILPQQDLTDYEPFTNETIT